MPFEVLSSDFIIIEKSESVEVSYEALKQQMKRDLVAQQRGKCVIAHVLSWHFQTPDQSTDGNWYGIVTVVSSEL